MKLNGAMADRFSTALRDAFSPEALDRMVFYKLDKHLSDLSPPGDAQVVTFHLIQAANYGDWADELVMAAREAAPSNARLYAFAQEFGLGATAAPRQELQRIIQEANSFLDPDRFRERMGALEPCICRIEINAAQGVIYGTGFLVSADVIMTNHHVVSPVLGPNEDGYQKKPSAVDARARFDYKRMYDRAGKLIRVNDGRTCAFAQDWLLDSSPTTPDGQVPQMSELDYALVRLEESVGDDVLLASPSNPVRRGFVDTPETPAQLRKDSSLFILQHPKADTLKVALATKSVLGTFDNGARVRYTTNTMPGSSGSPCFTADWELAALHHSGDPDFDTQHKPAYNEGIPIGAIQALITQHGMASALGVQQD